MNRYNAARKAGFLGLSGFGCFILVYLGVKALSLPVLVIQVINLIGAAQQGGVGQFDFTWLVVSAVGVILL